MNWRMKLHEAESRHIRQNCFTHQSPRDKSNLRFPPAENIRRLWLWYRGNNARFLDKSPALKREKFGPPWPGGRSLSYRCLRKSKNCVGQRGGHSRPQSPRFTASACAEVKSSGVENEGRLAVGYPYSIISLIQK